MDTTKKEGAHGLENDVDAMRLKFMESTHIEWTKFCESIGIEAHRSRQTYPVATWQDDKKKRIAMAEADKLGAMLFDRRFAWHKDVLTTLNIYPKIADQILVQIQRRLTHYSKMTDEEFNMGKKGKKATKTEPGTPDIMRVTELDLRNMAAAFKEITEAKHRSLLLNDWNVKQAQNETERDEEKDVTGSQLKITVEGKDLTLKEIEATMAEYYEQR